MKISNDESLRASRIGGISPASAADTKNRQATGASGSPAASVELSPQAQALAAAQSAGKAEAARFLPAVQAASDTRDDLVAKLKAQVDAGTYKVSGADIAEQMIRRAKADNLR